MQGSHFARNYAGSLLILYMPAEGLGVKSCLQDKAQLLEAAEKLRSARDFERGDAMVMNALGDTLLALADAAPEAPARKEHLHQALEKGFGAALHIDRRQPDALVGSAETQQQLGRCELLGPIYFQPHHSSCCTDIILNIKWIKSRLA